MTTSFRIYSLTTLALTMTACNVEKTELGISYTAEDAATVLPSDIGAQLDTAWQRVQATGCVTADVASVWTMVIVDGVITDSSGKKYWGQTFGDAYQTRLTLLNGRVPAAAHEMYHAALYLQTGDADMAHTSNCWNKMDGDTLTSLDK